MSCKCYNCQAQLNLSLNKDLSRTEDCPACHRDLRCCMMCVFYDESSYNECKEPTAERVLDKEKANFCDFFKLGNQQSSTIAKQSHLSAANALFKK